MHLILSHLRRLAKPASDAELLGRFVAARDESAFEELVRRHGPMVLGVCRRALGPTDADDAFQATFLVLARRAASVSPAARVGPWLYGVATRVALKSRAAKLRRREVERVALDRPSTSPELPDDLRPLIDEELGRLPEMYRAALVLCLIQETPRREAAVALGWTEGTLSGRLARAKAMLGDRLRRRGVELAGLPLLMDVPFKLAASAASPAAVALTEEVIRMMVMTKLKVVAGALVLLAGIGFGAGAMAYRPEPAAPPKDEAKQAAALAAKAKLYVIDPPDILSVRWRIKDDTATFDRLLVRPDGTIQLGMYGNVTVNGLTLPKARDAVANHLAKHLAGLDERSVSVDVVAVNSKVIYVIAEQADGSEQVVRLPAADNTSIDDAVAAAKLSPAPGASVRIYRNNPNTGLPLELRVDWAAITQNISSNTRYSLLPGDRLYVRRTATAVDLVEVLEEAVKSLREARSHDEQRRAFDDLDAVTKKLRDRLKKIE